MTRLVTFPPVTTASTSAPLPEVTVISGVLGNTSLVSTTILSTTCPDKIALALFGTPSTKTNGGLLYPLPWTSTVIFSKLPNLTLSVSLNP